MAQPAINLAPAQTAASPSERAPRKRRTQAEIAADNAAKAAQTGSPTPPAASGQPAQAPFPVNQPPAQLAGFGVAPGAPNGGPPAFGGVPQGSFGAPAAPAAPSGNTGSFGIQNGADPNGDPQLAAMLAGLGQ